MAINKENFNFSLYSMLKECLILLYKYLHGCDNNKQRKERTENILREANRLKIFNSKEAK